MKTDYGWNNGGNDTNSTVFQVCRATSASSPMVTSTTLGATGTGRSSPVGSDAWHRYLGGSNEGVGRNHFDHVSAFPFVASRF